MDSLKLQMKPCVDPSEQLHKPRDIPQACTHLLLLEVIYNSKLLIYSLQNVGDIGAGGQHACEVARALGMKKVFIHRFEIT